VVDAEISRRNQVQGSRNPIPQAAIEMMQCLLKTGMDDD
jgi:hypothetical protein